MKERPILFSAPMVRAILDGRKTQTRRVVKPQPYPNGIRFDGRDILCHDDDLPANAMLMDVGRGKNRYTTSNLEWWEIHCPYGQPGERLWVRESFSGPRCMDAQGGCAAAPPSKWGDGSRIWYWADGNPDAGDWTKPRPGIHMPRWASRIALEVTGVRVERLQSISEADAVAEGCTPDDECEQGFIDPRTGRLVDTWKYKAGTAVESFCNLWERIHEKRVGDHGAGSWEANPWVFVISFERV